MSMSEEKDSSLWEKDSSLWEEDLNDLDID